MDRLQDKKSRCKGLSVKYFDIKAADIVDSDAHVIEVKFAAFGNRDSDGDILVRGCFAKSINDRGPQSSTNRKIAFVWQHDIKNPIGKILDIWEAEDGAYARIRLSDFDAVPDAKRAFVRDGDIDQFSFGFEYVWDKVEYDETKDAFIVREVKLYEISVVTLGANEETGFVGEVKSEETVKSYIKQIAQDKDKLKELKQFIDDIQEAEPGEPLTSGMFEKLASINI